ncbi:MAG: hypothetical protein H0T39_08850 [Actinobacteria bacterium]|nr:hypothetical protein [Actinomycetota bacterium]
MEGKTARVTLACVASALVCAGAASAADYGVTEDEVKSHPRTLYPLMQRLGLRRNVISVTWDAERPTAPPRETAQIRALLPVAAHRGVRVAFALYGAQPTTFTGSPVRRAQLASWLAALARRHPTVKEYIGPNEPNQPRFWQPQFTPACANASGAAYAAVMGVMYDALKGVDRGIRVVGVGLSPRGNDSCHAPDNVSTSPVRFLRALGLAYRASGRDRPLMDGLAVHLYPNANTDPPSRGYRWPNIGAPNLARLKQAFWDGFGGTPQPTFEEGLRVDLEGVGWQVDTSEREGYHGLETVPPVSEATQGEYYARLVRSVSCDASVASLTIFHLVDEADRERFQTGLLRVDGSRRPSFDAVRAAVSRSARCRGKPTSWRHRTSVVGTRVDFGGLAPSWSRRRYWSFHAYAAEGASYSAGVHRLTRTRPGSGRLVLAMRGEVPAYYNVLVRAPRQRLRPGRYVYAITLRAETNPERTSSFVSDPFLVR